MRTPKSRQGWHGCDEQASGAEHTVGLRGGDAIVGAVLQDIEGEEKIDGFLFCRQILEDGLVNGTSETSSHCGRSGAWLHSAQLCVRNDSSQLAKEAACAAAHLEDVCALGGRARSDGVEHDATSYDEPPVLALETLETEEETLIHDSGYSQCSTIVGRSLRHPRYTRETS